MRPLWGQAARLERQAYAALAAVEERSRLFAAASTPKRLQQHLTKWEQLTQLAAAKVAQYDAFEGMIHLPEKHLYKLSRFTRQIREE